MLNTQETKAAAFRALHERDGVFAIPNPWDIGTARILAKLGFEALATTSAGLAFSLGRHDGAVSRAALGTVLRAAHEIRDHGSFTFAGQAASFAELEAFFD